MQSTDKFLMPYRCLTGCKGGKGAIGDAIGQKSGTVEISGIERLVKSE
ncbi:MAG: hypothetical protein EBE86_019055 [Hormoscilla sp. GUM202]|nr:hypothetical protein [Hormoscilla sp. GUM202]